MNRFSKSVTIIILLITTIAPRMSLATPLQSTTNISNASILCIAMYEGNEGVRFSLSGTVIIPLKQNLHLFAISDSTGIVILHKDASLGNRVLQTGDRIHVTGITKRQTPFSPCNALCTEITYISRDSTPLPDEVSTRDFTGGQCDNRLIRLSGTVRDAFRDEIDPLWKFLVIRDQGETIYACFTSILPLTKEINRLIGAKISVSGLASTQITAPRHLFGRCLLFADLDDITIIRPAPDNPFSAPPLITKRHVSVAAISDMERRRVAGRVIAVWRGDRILLKTTEGQIVRIDLANGSIPKYGDSIEAVGNPETDLYRLNLSRAIWRTNSIPTLLEETDKPVTAKELLSDSQGLATVQTAYHGQPVSIKGIVRSMPSSNTPNNRLGLECDGQIIPVDTSARPEAIDNIKIGCLLKVSGTFLVETENWRPNAPFPHIDGFAIAVRTPKDVQILSRPPWWTPGKLFAVIAALITALAGIIVWNRSLNRLAKRRGYELIEETVARATSDLKVGERTRLAIELHDSLSQNLTGASLEVETASMLAPPNAIETIQHLGIVTKTLKSCREELRNCLWDLRNDTLGEKTMNAAITSILSPHISDTSVTVEFNVPRDIISDSTAHAILRIIRELVQNAIRHGKASVINISGQLHENRLLFSIKDNGCGFDINNTPGVRQGHFGLQGIRERINQIGGEMCINSKPGSGTKISISIKK